MLIPPEEAKLFFSLYPSLIGFAAGRAGGIDGINDTKTFRSATWEVKIQDRDYLLENIGLISNYINENPDEFRERDLSRRVRYRGTGTGLAKKRLILVE